MDTQTLLIAIFASSGFWGVVLYLLQRRDRKKSWLEKGTLALLHDRIYDITEKAIEEGSITLDEMDNLTCLYEPYHAGGGNGTGEERYNKVKTLPIKQEK